MNKLKDTKTLAIIITASILLIIGIAVAIVLGVRASKEDKNFDYLTSDLSKYISLSKDDYKNYKLEIDIAKPHDIDVDVAILNLIVGKKGDALNDGALITSPVTITAGDTVHIWYRGYLLDEDGEEIALSGMSNLSGSAASELSIGSGNFIPGFELNLVGKNTGDYPKFVKITDGTPNENRIAYVSYTRLVEGGDESKDAVSATAQRIILSDTDIDSVYGDGFREKILGAQIGKAIDSFDVTLDGKKHTYSDTKIVFVTECEVEPLLVECYFPYDYNTTTLRNETAYFEVYVEGVVQYECPEFNDEFVSKIISEKDAVITEEELLEYEGETLTEKYRAFVKKLVDEAYEEEYETLVEEAMWEHYLSKAEVKKYPTVKVDEIYKEYEDDVYYQFDQSGGSLQNQYTEEYETYEDIDSFAVAYLGLTYSENKDWRAVLRTMSEELVKERLVLYYLMQEENINPTAEELAEELAAVKQEYIDEYVKQYLDYEGKTRADYTEEEFSEFVETRKEELFDYYDEDYFLETTYYEIALKEFIKWPNISTLDDRRAYPLDK